MEDSARLVGPQSYNNEFIGQSLSQFMADPKIIAFLARLQLEKRKRQMRLIEQKVREETAIQLKLEEQEKRKQLQRQKQRQLRLKRYIEKQRQKNKSVEVQILSISTEEEEQIKPRPKVYSKFGVEFKVKNEQLKQRLQQRRRYSIAVRSQLKRARYGTPSPRGKSYSDKVEVTNQKPTQFPKLTCQEGLALSQADKNRRSQPINSPYKKEGAQGGAYREARRFMRMNREQAQKAVQDMRREDEKNLRVLNSRKHDLNVQEEVGGLILRGLREKIAILGNFE